jgi:hypothetical protein
MKSLISTLIIVLSLFNIIYNKSEDYEHLLEWGKSHSVFISDKIAMNYTSENIKNFYVTQEIEKNETIMIIPSDLVLNIDRALNLSGSKTKKLYEKYKNEKFEYVNAFIDYRIEQSFLAYLMYSANKHKSEKNKLYQFFKYFFNTFETNMDSFPLFYNAEQFNLLTSSLFGNEIFQMRALFDEEYSILDQRVLKKGLDYDEYLRHRQYTLSKGRNITKKCSLVPFVDMFDIHPTKYNLKLRIRMDDYGIKVVAKKKIKPNRKLLLKIDSLQNSNLLCFYGKTFKESENTVNNFLVPYISSLYLTERNLDQSLANNEKIDLAREKFYEEAMKTYMEFSKKIKEDGSPLSALNIFKGNLQALRKKYDEVSTSQIHKTFFTLKDIENIKRVLSTEMRFYDEKMKVLDVLIDYTIKNQTKNETEDDEKDPNLDL